MDTVLLFYSFGKNQLFSVLNEFYSLAPKMHYASGDCMRIPPSPCHYSSLFPISRTMEYRIKHIMALFHQIPEEVIEFSYLMCIESLRTSWGL